MATDTRSPAGQPLTRETLPSLPRLPHHQQVKDSPLPAHPCRRRRRLKKREFKSASLLTSGSNVTSPVERSINSASSVFPTSTPVETPSSSKRTSRSNSIKSSESSKRGGDNAKRDAEKNREEENDTVGDLQAFLPKYSDDYEQKKQRVLQNINDEKHRTMLLHPPIQSSYCDFDYLGSFKVLLQNYFPDLIKSQKMLLPSVLEPCPADDGYDTDLDPDLGLELLADERSRRCVEDGSFAEYKQLCRKHKVVPNSFFMRHSMNEHLRLRPRYFSYGDSAALSHEIQNQPSVTSLDIEDNYMGPAGMLCFAEMLKSNAYITEANLANNHVGVYGARLMKFILTKNVRLVKLNMSGNKFGERGARYCAAALNNNATLRELNISNNSIHDEGACLIGKALANNTGLEHLDMSWNNIGKKGATGLSKGIKANDRLLSLKLRMNGCHDEGCRALVGTLRFNDTLQELDLGANRVGAEGCKAVIRALPYLRLQILRMSMNPLGTENAQTILKGLLALENPPMKEIDFDSVVVEDDFQLLAEELAQRGCHVVYRIPPSSRERSRDLPLETLTHVMSFLDDVEIDPSVLFPDPGDGDLIMTVQDLFTHMENSGMFRDKTRLFKLKQESQRDFRRRFLLRELMMVNTQRKQSMVDVMNSAQAVDNLDLTGSLEGLTTGRSSFSGDTMSN